MENSKLLDADYESVLNSIQELIFVVNTKRKIVGFNNLFAMSVKPCLRKDILGANFNLILQKYWGKGRLQECCKETIDSILVKGKYNTENEFLRAGHPTFCVAKGRHGNGEEGFFKVRSFPSFGRDREIRRIVCVVNNITSLIEMSQKLQDLNKKLEQKVLERTKQLKEAIDLKSRFVADVSHELRTPLTIMRGNMDILLRTREFNEEEKEMLDIVEGQINYMSRMLLDLAMLAKGDRDISGLNVEKINIQNLAAGIVKIFGAVAKKRGITLEFSRKKEFESVFVEGDREKIERMVSNLISNAIKYGKDSGWIKIDLERKGGFIAISVSDNGLGIPKKDLSSIFERFFRIKRFYKKDSCGGGEDSSGSGLGLAICKWVAEVHGGKISVESRVNKGSTFTAHLPTLINKI